MISTDLPLKEIQGLDDGMGDTTSDGEVSGRGRSTSTSSSKAAMSNSSVRKYEESEDESVSTSSGEEEKSSVLKPVEKVRLQVKREAPKPVNKGKKIVHRIKRQR